MDSDNDELFGDSDGGLDDIVKEENERRAATNPAP